MKSSNKQFVAGPAPKSEAAQFWNVFEMDDDTGVIELTGDVVSERPYDWWTLEPIPGNYITPEGFRESLEAVKNKSNILVRINSCGGDLYTGIAIHNAIADLKANKTVLVDGIAASAASVIACQPDADVQIYPGSMIMIHGAACTVCDYMDAEEAEKLTKALKAANKAIAQIYSQKTGTTVETLLNMMSRETWMVGSEAIDKGFADTLLGEETEPELEYEDGAKYMMVAGVRHDISSFKNLPKTKILSGMKAKAEPVGNIKPTGDGGNPQGGKPRMTLEELRAQEPDLVSQIEADAVSASANSNETAVANAVTAERERLQRINEIAGNIADRELVNAAMFGENPMTAEQLAFEALKRTQNAGARFVQDLENDANNSGANSVAPAANGGPEVDDEVDTQGETLKRMAMMKAEAKAKAKEGGNK